jgi:hypothetical protein
MRELNKVLDPEEKVFWEGKPSFWPFVFSVIPIMIFGLFFLIIGGTITLTSIKTGNFLTLLFPHFWFGVAMVFGSPLYRILVHKYTYYAVTDKRVILQGGLIGRDFSIVDFDQITNAEVNVGILDQIFGGKTGSIFISTAGTFSYGKHGPVPRPYSLSHINNPYEVFKFFKKISHDVKTDIEYPNALRPQSNPGYKTNYSPDQKQP